MNINEIKELIAIIICAIFIIAFLVIVFIYCFKLGFKLDERKLEKLELEIRYLKKKEKFLDDSCNLMQKRSEWHDKHNKE